MKRPFVDQLVQNRFRSAKQVRELIEREEKERRTRHLPEYLTGTHNGVFFRVKVPPRKALLPNLPKLGSPIQSPPRQFREAPHRPAGPSPASQTPKEAIRENASRFQEWFAENWSVIVFNLGSIASLIGFTRSDVLELRVLSVTGSMTSVFYNFVQKPLRWPPIMWGLTFASVNGWKIFEIFQERKATVHLTAQEEDVYVEHFLPHGVTPKQFEAISQKAQIMRVRKGKILIRKGDQLKDIYLVVEGSTSATILGRHLTAASVTPTAHLEKKGGASGAWIGEMAFLENYWIKEQGKKIPVKRQYSKGAQDKEKGIVPKEVTKGPASKVPASEPKKDTAPTAKPKSETSTAPKPFKPPEDVPLLLKSNEAMYTIVTKEDCTILRWSQEDMEELMQRSTDLRAALTRAMASAIVGKVINFTVSRSNASSWTNWLSDWNTADGAIVEIEETETDASPKAAGSRPEEKLPSYPIKRFNS